MLSTMPSRARGAARPGFTSAAAEARYFAAYDAVLARWPVEVSSFDVPSPYGTTHVCVCGPQDGEPLVLLHGGGATSTVWFANVEALSRGQRIYAVDLIGDAGRSVADGARIRRPADLMQWLDGLFDHLGLRRLHMGGHSYGGWVALSYALYAPERLRSLLLIEPTQCFAGMALAYRLHAIPLLLAPNADRMRSFLRWETAGRHLEPTWLTLMALGASDYPRPTIVLPHQPKAAALRRLTVPTLVVLAGQSRSHQSRRVAAGVRRSMPHSVVAVLPDETHHTLPTENPVGLNRELLRFLEAC